MNKNIPKRKKAAYQNTPHIEQYHEIKRIKICPIPLQSDIDCTLIYRDIQGKFYEVFGACDLNEKIEGNWQEIEAVQIRINKRTTKIFVPAQIADKEDITPNFNNILHHANQ